MRKQKTKQEYKEFGAINTEADKRIKPEIKLEFPTPGEIGMPEVEDTGEKLQRKKFLKIPLPFFHVKAGVTEISKRQGLSKIDRWKLNKFPSHTFLIEMFFSNGTSKTWVIKTRKETFTYKKRTYYLRYADSWFNLSNNQYKLYYHEDFVVPIDREVAQLENTDAETGFEKAYFSVTPHNVKPIIEYEYVGRLVSSETFNKWLKLSVILSAISLLLIVIHVFGIVKTG